MEKYVHPVNSVETTCCGGRKIISKLLAEEEEKDLPQQTES
jgi:hypothetical protein